MPEISSCNGDRNGPKKWLRLSHGARRIRTAHFLGERRVKRNPSLGNWPLPPVSPFSTTTPSDRYGTPMSSLRPDDALSPLHCWCEWVDEPRRSAAPHFPCSPRGHVYTHKCRLTAGFPPARGCFACGSRPVRDPRAARPRRHSGRRARGGRLTGRSRLRRACGSGFGGRSDERSR